MDKPSMIEMLKRIARGISEMFGSSCEVVIHDLDDPDNSIIGIYNGHVTGRVPGDPLSMLGMKNVRAGMTGDDLVGYMARTSDGRPLKCSTFHIIDKEYRLALGINFDCSGLKTAADAIGALLSVSAKETSDTFTAKGLDLKSLVDGILPPDRQPGSMKKKDKIQVIKELDKKGAFLFHGSVQAVSDRLGISRFTLYNYLKEIRNDI